MNDPQLIKLDNRLKEIGDRTKPFGGFSIIFAGDFRQLQAVKSLESDLLFSTESSKHWENSINVVIILENDHRFKDDPEYGWMLKRMWSGDLTKKDRERINTRVIGRNGVQLDKNPTGDAAYACCSNKERNSISSGNFRNQILATHPSVGEDEMPPPQTIVIEAAIRSSISKKANNMKIDRVLRHRIITTCGDGGAMQGTKHVYPVLCLYVGSHLICVIDNKHLSDKVPRRNGTL
jgi:hypothetical protein